MGKVTGLVFPDEKKRGKKNKTDPEPEQPLTDDVHTPEAEKEDGATPDS